MEKERFWKLGSWKAEKNYKIRIDIYNIAYLYVLANLYSTESALWAKQWLIMHITIAYNFLQFE